MAPPTSDFKKRPKAKVGKRAPAKLNATDTSFKTSSVAVRSQDQSLQKNKHITKQSHDKDSAPSISAAARLELASSRGNALSTLQTSLRHHAPAVRASGLKGIRDAVQSLSSLEDTLGTTILEANLPSLLPNMCRCWLDEDDDVRNLAIKLLGDIITKLSSSLEQSDLKCLAPFVPILGAYASSALNSLDRSIRKDGASIVGILASADPSPSYSLIASSTDEEGEYSAVSREMGKHIYSFIPPLERLLLSMSLGSREKSKDSPNEGGSNKRKRDENKNKQPIGSFVTAKDSTLLTVALLLRASLALDKNGRSSNTANSGCINRRLAPSLTVCGECTFLSGGSARANSILLFREGESGIESHSPIRSIFDLPWIPIHETMEVGEYDNNTKEHSIPGRTSSTKDEVSLLEKVQVLNSLLETLRVKFVELTHSGRKPSNEADGLIMSMADLDVIDTLVQTIRFVHQHCLSLETISSEYKSSDQIKSDGKESRRPSKKRGKKTISESQSLGDCIVAYRTTVKKTLALLLESFPIFPMDSKSASRYELTNAGFCSALAELGGGGKLSEEMTQNSYQWISSVFSYVLPRLDPTNAMEDNSAATNMLLKVLNRLLLPHDFHSGSDTRELKPSYLLDNPSNRQELLESFAGAFFPQLAYPSGFVQKNKRTSSIYSLSVSDEVEQQIYDLASTGVGKTAAMSLVTFMIQEGHLSKTPMVADNEHYEKRIILILQMSSVLPLYIKSWGGRLPNETGLVLSSLIAIVRQWPALSDEVLTEDVVNKPIEKAIDDLCLGLRCSLEMLYTTKNKKTPSIFETLPEQVQKLSVGLIGMLKFPSEALIRSLSKICSKSSPMDEMSNVHPGDYPCISSSMAAYIMEVMHSLRKTMPMPAYLTFLLDSSGINCVSGVILLPVLTPCRDRDGILENSLSDAVFYYDRSVEQLCRFLTTSCDSASTKVLPMIIPVLLTWLSPSSSANDDIVKQLVQVRAATSILAAFTWDDVLSCGIEWDKTDIVTPPDFVQMDKMFDEILVDSIINQFELSVQLRSIDGGRIMDDNANQQQFLARLLGPVTILLRYRRGMFEKFVARGSRRIVQQNEDNAEAERSTTSSAARRDPNDIMDKELSIKVDAADVHIKTLLLMLKSTYPASIAELLRSSDELPATLLSAAVEIDKSVSRGHLAHLGSKLLHQVKLFQ